MYFNKNNYLSNKTTISRRKQDKDKKNTKMYLTGFFFLICNEILRRKKQARIQEVLETLTIKSHQVFNLKQTNGKISQL